MDKEIFKLLVGTVVGMITIVVCALVLAYFTYNMGYKRSKIEAASLDTTSITLVYDTLGYDSLYVITTKKEYKHLRIP